MDTYGHKGGRYGTVEKVMDDVEVTMEVVKNIILKMIKLKNLLMDSSSKLNTEELFALEMLISSDTIACEEEEQEFWNTIVRKLRKNHDS